MPKRKSGMNHAGCLVVALVLATITETSGEPPPYTRVDSYRALRLTYADLSLLLLEVQEILQGAATDSSEVQVDWMSVSSAARAESDASVSPVVRESERLTLTGYYVYTAFADAPPQARRVFYQFHATNHPITNVLIRLEHSNRDVTVAGTSRFQVVRLADAIRTRLESRELSTTRNGFLVYGNAILYFLLFAAPVFVFYRFRGILNHTVPLFIALAAYAMLCRYLMAENLWAAWFPATGISHGKPGIFF